MVALTPGTEHLCDRISSATSRWDAVCRRAIDWKSQLESSLQQQVREYVKDLSTWMYDARDELLTMDMNRPIEGTMPYRQLEAKNNQLSVRH